MRKLIENNKNLEILIPFAQLGTFAELVNQALIMGFPHENIDIDGELFKVVYLNYLSDADIRTFISLDIEVNYLKGGSQPYVQILKADLNADFDNEYRLENETHYLIPIASYEGGTRANYTQFAEIKQWVAIYGIANLYSDSKILINYAE